MDQSTGLSRLPPSRSFWDKLGDTWPAQLSKSAWGAVTLPGDVYAGRVDPASDRAIARSFDLAGLLATGAPVTAVDGALGAAGGRLARKAALPMDEASRLARAQELGFRTNMPLYGSAAPQGEQVAASAVKVGDQMFTGPSHLAALDRAQAQLGVSIEQLPITDSGGFVTTGGRYVSRYEAQDIARATGRATQPTAMPGYMGQASEDLLPASFPGRKAVRTGATAPGLPGGGEGVWLAVEPGPETVQLWHRTARPVAADVHQASLPEIHATLMSAWDAGFDAVLLRNYTTPAGKTTNVFVVKDQSQLRAPSAKFDPAKRMSPDIFAGIAGLAALPGGGSLDFGDFFADPAGSPGWRR